MNRKDVPPLVASRAALLFAALAAMRGLHAAEPGDASELARRIVETAGVRGGLVVHLGCGDGKLTAALRANEAFIVHGLDADVTAPRRHIESLGLYGPVSVEKWADSRLPYVDNLVNLVVSDSLGKLPMNEIVRVLAPNGVAIIGGNKTVKPRPKEIDEWTHYLHGPVNNAVAEDTVVGPPRHFQWIGSPDYLRHHDHMSGLSAMVSAKGRLFYIMDLGPRWSVQMPPQWMLLARDAFNGTILWQRPIEKWHPHLWGLKHGPAQIMRRLVAAGDTVYVTLGYGEPVTALDAATGKTLRIFAGTEGTEELLLADGVLYVLVHPEGDVYRTVPRDSVEAIRSATRTWNWDEKPRRILAIEAAAAKTRWSHTAAVAPGTLGAAGGRVCFHDGEKVVCLDARDGGRAWTSKPVPRWKPLHVMFSPTLIVRRDVVLFAGGEKFDPQRGGNDTMTALSAETGEVLWTAPHPASGYASAEDLFVINDLVWCGVTSSPRD
ncbi:MAG: PQQ-binding-like beta-propeller repeat protein [Pirellulales bacterium]|nr:PQQ-binding-like beta-propeller repeat protein [Pirellulales bacterium]